MRHRACSSDASGVNALAVLITSQTASPSAPTAHHYQVLDEMSPYLLCLKLVQTYVVYCGIVDPVPGGHYCSWP